MRSCRRGKIDCVVKTYEQNPSNRWGLLANMESRVKAFESIRADVQSRGVPELTMHTGRETQIPLRHGCTGRCSLGGRGRRPRRPATAIKRKSRCGAVAGGRGRPPLPVGTLRAGFAVKCERMRPFARRGNESTSNGIEANVFPFLRVMRRVTDASVEEVALEANVMCL